MNAKKGGRLLRRLLYIIKPYFFNCPSISILGMNLFGCKFCTVKEDGQKDCDRKNFDSLLWAIITVFQVKKKNIKIDTN